MFKNSFFMRIVQLLRSSWTITLLGFLALSFLIWFGGPLIAIAGSEPLVSPLVRCLVIVVLALVFVVYKYWKHVRTQESNKQAVKSLLDGEDSHDTDEEGNQEVDTLRERIVTALDVLKNSNLTKGNGLYHLPWYILIGPPGTGKTTILHNSGLEFPLKDKLGEDPLSGIGGTRHCDWWFTNKAVLIDTAGRYTTQDSNRNRDSRAWLGFLGLLKKHRTKRPINGAIVTVSLASLMQQTRTERNLHARAIKVRIQELKNQLGMQFPVYMMLTKADLIAGFSEYFDDLDIRDRDQVWGATFPLEAEDPSTGVVGLFNKEFHALLKRIYRRHNQRILQERDIDKRTLIYEFPKQMHLLQATIDDFLKEIFTPNAYEESLMLRGVYIVSATQEGKPIDRVIAETSGNLNLGQVPLRHHSGEGKSYFVKRLLEDVIFPEQFIGSVNRYHQKHTVWLRRIVAGMCTASLLGLSLLWYNSYSWNKQLIIESEKAVEQYKSTVEPGLNPDTDIITLVEGLDALASLPAGYDSKLISNDVHRMGLYQGDKIGQPAKMAYLRALQGYFSTYLTDVLKKEITANEDYLEYLYESLKTYLMIHDPEHRELEQIYGWFEVYFERHFPGEVNESLRQDLMVHTRNLFGNNLNFSKEDKQVVEQARRVLTRIPLAERAYQRLRIEFLSSHVADFRLSDVLGRQGRQVVTRRSGASLHDGIPGLYTYNGYHSIFRVENNRIVKRLMEDSWVYGDSLSINEANKKEVVQSVRERYFYDYIDEWRNYLADIEIRPYSSAGEGALLANNLTSAEQPVQSLIKAVQKELRLTSIPVSDNAKVAGKVAGKVADVALRNQKARINRFVPDDTSMANVKLPGKEVESAFSSILAVSEADLKEVQVTLLRLRDYLELLAESNNKQAYTSLMDDGDKAALNNALRRSEKILPAPFSHWLNVLSGQTSNLAKRGAQVHLNAIWKDSVYKEYQTAIRGKYPFNRNAKSEVRLKDFSRFFGYGGTMDRFFAEYLKSSVDTSKRRWKLERSVGIRSESLRIFKQARRIRDTFFEPGTQNPRVEFGLKPMFLDAHISNFRFELGQQQMVYRHGPQRSTLFTWPTSSGNSGVRLSFVPPKSGHSISETYSGNWGLFRMLEELATTRPESSKDNVLEIGVKGNTAMLKLEPESAINPFWTRNLARFTCTPTL